MARLTLVLFRDRRGDGLDVVAGILHDIILGGANRYALTEIDVHDRPELAVQYNIQTTPTILLMRDGDVVDRVVGTPTRILLDNLLESRTMRAPTAAVCNSCRAAAAAG